MWASSLLQELSIVSPLSLLSLPYLSRVGSMESPPSPAPVPAQCQVPIKYYIIYKIKYPSSPVKPILSSPFTEKES